MELNRNQMDYSEYVIYVDESGDHSLNSINPQYPVFVLVFCIFKKTDYANSVVPKFENFKFKHFGHDAVILHESDMRKQLKPFVFLKIRAKRNDFMDELNSLIEGVEFTVVATVIEKKKLVKSYEKLNNPYGLALKFCLERAFEFLRDKNQHHLVTHVVVEQRGRREDDELKLDFRRICGGENDRSKKFNFEIVFADKKINSTGLQLADLTARPIGLKALHPEQQNRALDIIETKFQKNKAGGIVGWGFKVFPP